MFYKKLKRNYQSEDYQSSVSDLMSALVFIFIITVVLLTIQLQQLNKKSADALNEHKRLQIAKETLIKTIAANLEKKGIKVEPKANESIIRLPESTVSFNPGEDIPLESGKIAIKALAEELKVLLDCKNNLIKDLCIDGRPNIDSIFIEGHSDHKSLKGLPLKIFTTNLNLSVQRALRTFEIMEEISPEVTKLKNIEGNNLVTVSGYGEKRPLKGHEIEVIEANPAKKNQLLSENRRIDIRFIMGIPTILKGP